METNVKEVLNQINESSLVINTCARSLEYLQKDLDELEGMANSAKHNYYIGLTNIVEQMSRIIRIESEKIMELSE